MWRAIFAVPMTSSTLPRVALKPKKVLGNSGIRLVFCGNGKLSSDHYLSSREYSVSHQRLISHTVPSQCQAYSKNKQQSKKTDGVQIPFGFGGWFLLVIPVSTLILGVWQVYRWRWKLGLIEEMKLKTTADPVMLPLDYSALEDLEYRKVKVRGTFDYSKELMIGPRSLVHTADKSDKSRGVFSSSSSQHGFHVITPFKLEGTNESILINRGWIGSRNVSQFKHLEAPVDIIGIVRKPENRSPFMAKSRSGQAILHYRDVPLMAAALNTEEVFLDLHSIDGVDFSQARSQNIPVPGQTRVTLRNEHVSYFVTWFSLSAITTYMWHRMFIRGLSLL